MAGTGSSSGTAATSSSSSSSGLVSGSIVWSVDAGSQGYAIYALAAADDGTIYGGGSWEGQPELVTIDPSNGSISRVTSYTNVGPVEALAVGGPDGGVAVGGGSQMGPWVGNGGGAAYTVTTDGGKIGGVAIDVDQNIWGVEGQMGGGGLYVKLSPSTALIKMGLSSDPLNAVALSGGTIYAVGQGPGNPPSTFAVQDLSDDLSPSNVTGVSNEAALQAVAGLPSGDLATAAVIGGSGPGTSVAGVVSVDPVGKTATSLTTVSEVALPDGGEQPVEAGISIAADANGTVFAVVGSRPNGHSVTLSAVIRAPATNGSPTWVLPMAGEVNAGDAQLITVDPSHFVYVTNSGMIYKIAP